MLLLIVPLFRWLILRGAVVARRVTDGIAREPPSEDRIALSGAPKPSLVERATERIAPPNSHRLRREGLGIRRRRLHFWLAFPLAVGREAREVVRTQACPCVVSGLEFWHARSAADAGLQILLLQS